MSIPSRGVSLASTLHSEVAPSLPLPALPVFCGAADREIRFSDELSTGRALNRRDVLAQAQKIADLLRETDASYINLRDDTTPISYSTETPSDLYNTVLRYNSEAFEYSIPGPLQEPVRTSNAVLEKKSVEQSVHIAQAQREHERNQNHLMENTSLHDTRTPSRKSKSKKKGSDETKYSATVDSTELRDAAISAFCEAVEDFCGRAEIVGDDRDEAEWLSLPVSDVRLLVNEVLSMRTKKILHLVPVDTLLRLLRVLDHQIHRAEGLSVDDCEHSDSDAVSTVLCALESIHAALGIMVHNDMPKLLYKEEVIERILEFSRHQIMDVMAACDPSYRAVHKPNENGIPEADEDEDFDADFGSASKKRRTSKTVKAKKPTGNRVSAAVNNILQKLCTILGFLKDLLLMERLSDSCILQLVKTSFTTFLVDNIQLLQLKAISLISAIFYSYTQHRTYVIDETLQLLWKLPVSKRAQRAYHLPDEEQRQIQMVTALLIQLVHCSANLPEFLRQESNASSIFEVSIDATYPTKCHDAVTEACCLFWSRFLQRLTTVKTHDASELKVMMENIVMDLLTTLNLPEYPASAHILEVLCVLLLQNAGLKSKDISARSMAIDLLGTIAARLKHDAVLCSRDKFWITQELVHGDSVQQTYPTDACSICLDGKAEKALFVCQGCRKLFHADCMGVRDHEVPTRGWYCQFCLCRKQLVVLQSYCTSQCKDDGKIDHTLSEKSSEAGDAVTKLEIVQQMLLNYLHDSGSADDAHHFSRWFYLCLWYKDDPKNQDKFIHYLARLKCKSIVRDSGAVSSLLTRDSVKKITLALGQNNSFSRGFDTILHLLLVSLRESSPIIRAKALRAVSIIVEADPEVLCEKRVQLAVEGRFCDSAISAREAALELVGRHIASHPDVGLKYFEKVAERIKDTGVSVRKRAIKIIRDMCTSNANFSEFTSACVEIISRVSDEESSIQDLVCRTFYEFWFEEPSGSQSQFFGDGSSVPLEVAKKTEQIVEVLRKMPNNQLLLTVIKRNLALDFFPQSAKAVGINPVSIASVRKRCELMCKCLLERILQVEETNNEEGEIRALPYVLVLHTFCVVDPTLCAPASDPSQFVVTLQPYLKSQVDNRIVARLLESIIFVIDAVLPLLRKLPQSVIEEFEQDLKHMIVRHSFLTVVHACIRCLCSVSKIGGKGASIIEYLIHVFFKRLNSVEVDNKQLLGRSLFCLGLLIRYGNSLLSNSGNRNIDVMKSVNLFKKYLRVDDFVIKVRSLQALGYVLIARPDLMLDRDVGKILEATLSSGSDVRLKMQALQNMYEYLLDAESQMESEKTSNTVVHGPTEGGNSVPVAAGAGDTNICGGIVQLYWDNILGRCLDSNEHIRQSALKIVEIVLRQGLVHPITCVPFLIALETDPQDTNSTLAHHLLMNMNEKYPAFFESRLGDGLQLSFIFIQTMSANPHERSNPKFKNKEAGKTNGKSDGDSFAYARVGVSRIYKLIRGNRVSRNKFMSSVVRKFDNPTWRPAVVPFLMYCTEILSLLPFTSPDEPLYLIYTMNRVIQVRAGALEANMKAWSSYLQQGDGSNIHQQNGMIQQEPNLQGNGVIQQHPNPQLNGMIQQQPNLQGNGMIQQQPNPQPPVSNRGTLIDTNGIVKQEPVDEADYSHTHTASVVHKIEPADDPTSNLTTAVGEIINPTNSGHSLVLSADDLKKIQADCLAATALQLLLKLKRHLKIVYNLNDERCQTFSPTEPVKTGESLSRQSFALDISDARTDLPSKNEDLIQRYQEFKNALKEDTVDYSTYTANIKRKRPPPAKRSGSPTPATATATAKRGGGNPTNPTPTKRGVRPRRAKARNEDDDDDDDDEDDDEDDDDWTGGNKRPSNTARQGNTSARVTRQRL